MDLIKLALVLIMVTGVAYYVTTWVQVFFMLLTEPLPPPEDQRGRDPLMDMNAMPSDPESMNRLDDA